MAQQYDEPIDCSDNDHSIAECNLDSDHNLDQGSSIQFYEGHNPAGFVS